MSPWAGSGLAICVWHLHTTSECNKVTPARAEFTQLCFKCGCTLNCSFHIHAPCWPSLFLFSKAVITDEFCSSPQFASVWVYTAGVKEEHAHTEKQKALTAFIRSPRCCQTVTDCPWPVCGSCHISLIAQRNGVWLRLFFPWILRGLY